MSESRPTVADIGAITALAEDPLRNLRITQCYHELSQFVRRVFAGPGANWCTFATWASKQAGHTIRKEDLADVVRARLGTSAEHEAALLAVLDVLRTTGPGRDVQWLIDTVVRALDADAALDRAALAVAIGNRRVFEEIAPLFARFLETIDENGRVRPHACAALLDSMLPGEPPDGQARLREAFGCYREALAATDAHIRSQKLYHANLLVGLHEQTRLQPQIMAALDSAFDATAVRRRLLAELLPAAWLRLRYRVAAMFGFRPPLDDAIDELLSGVQAELRRVITSTAMSLALPRGRLIQLGHDITEPYPATLATIDDPSLAALLDRIDARPGTPAGSGARDWAAIEDRMQLIAELFRCFQEWGPLFDPPFGAEQIAAIREGRLPGGPL